MDNLGLDLNEIIKSAYSTVMEVQQAATEIVGIKCIWAINYLKTGKSNTPYSIDFFANENLNNLLMEKLAQKLGVKH